MPNRTRASLLAAAFLLAHTFLPGSALRAQQLDPSFHPPVFTVAAAYGTPYVDHARQQADGRYVVSGRFQAVDGHATAGIARLLADGHVDTTFTFRSAMFLASSGWAALAVQADGKILYSLAYSAPQGVLQRLLPSGQPDTGFRPALASRTQGGFLSQVEVLPSGKLLLAGAITDSLGRNGLVRLLPSGRVDTTFTPPPFAVDPDYLSVLVEPGGRMVYARSPFQGIGPPTSMGRLLASGRVDSSFTFSLGQYPSSQISKVVQCADGSYMLGGWFRNGKAVAHLLATGAWDNTYSFSLNCFAISIGYGPNNPISSLAVLPNGKTLAAGSMLSSLGDAPMLQALNGGGDDPAFNPNFIYTPYPYRGNVYNSGRVMNLLLEPNGRLLVAGQFSQAGTVPHTGLARLLPAAPLATQGAAAAAAPLEVWPVPAHAQLSVRLPAGPLPQQVALLDATGRPVLAQQPNTAAFTLNTAALPAGLYVLRVQHADGSVASRRVVVE